MGTRPQLIKAAAARPALERRHRSVLVDTGQHYDDEMAGRFFEELGLPAPDRSLRVGGLSRAAALAAMIERLEPVLVELRPDAVVVYGDTISTLAGALAAAALDLPLAHVEAGLRSGDRRMPEEQNRVVVDHLAGLLFPPGPEAVANLAAEGIVDGAAGRRVAAVGDLMQDLCAVTLPAARDASPLAGFDVSPGRYVFATVHRAENRGYAAVREWLAVLDGLARADGARRPVVLALHPGTARAIEEAGAAVPPTVRIIAPQGYRMTLTLQLHAAAVVTDSGGVQREAAWLGTPALVLRETTEWPETLEGHGGRGALVGRDAGRALEALARLAPRSGAVAAAERRAREAVVPPAGAAEAIAAELERWRP
ncbi:MAG: UDP-N-acetylglucosamine 2-epimerase [Chloroflexi bacterium GWC2_73_18]|nr:MAG: UDP-N-acetylglucosamine 2-epimerase [Chloroflexi bacterium GWC2_73_18]